MRSKLLYGAIAALLIVPARMPVIAQNLAAPGRVPVEAEKPLAAAQTGPSGIITTVAGDGYMGNDGNGGLATAAHLIYPQGVAVDHDGNIYVSDSFGQVVRKITVSTGVITDVAGTGDGGYTGDKGPANKAQLKDPYGIAVDSSGNVFIADTGNNVIRKVDVKTGIITTVAGNGYGADAGGFVSGCGAPTDGIKATASSLCLPEGVAVDKAGNLFIADTRDFVVREVAAATGLITTVAGPGNGNVGASTYNGGLAVNATLRSPTGVAVDDANNLFIADTNNCAVFKVAGGILTTAAGMPLGSACGLSGDGGAATSAKLDSPAGIAVDKSGNLFIADQDNFLVRMVAASNGDIYTVAGSYFTYTSGSQQYSYGNIGYSGDDGPAAYAELAFPWGVAVDGSGNLYIADTENSSIRKVEQSGVLPKYTPVLSPLPGVVAAPAAVKITSPLEEAKIYYTTDGSIPSTNSMVYSDPIPSVGTETITAFSTIPGSANSLATIGRYFYAPTPVISPGTENIAKATSVTITEANPKATVYYTTDGSQVQYADSAKKYTRPITISASAVLNAQAVVTDTQGYTGWSATATATYAWLAAPTVTALGISESGSNSAMATVTINPNNLPTQYWYAYGTSATALTTATPKMSAGSGPRGVVEEEWLNGLTPNATYYIQAVASNSMGTAKSAIQSLTMDYYADPPVITPGSETINEAIQVKISEDNPKATIYYTTDGTYPENSSTAKKYTAPLTISSTTTLTAQAEAVNAQQGPVWGGLASANYFVPAAPIITNEGSEADWTTFALISAYINPNGDTTTYWFAYGTSSTALTSTTAKTQGLTGSYSSYVEANVNGLKASTKYYYQAVAQNAKGTTKAPVMSFTTTAQ